MQICYVYLLVGKADLVFDRRMLDLVNGLKSHAMLDVQGLYSQLAVDDPIFVFHLVIR